MRALVEAVRAVVQSGVDAKEIVALALDTTGSSVIPVDAQMQPLDEYMLWCDHRAHKRRSRLRSWRMRRAGGD
jgi:L-ribulokinase